MTGNHRDDSHLDAALDRAVRDIMRAEPRAGLRERVLAELAGERTRVAWWPRLALGAAALATIVVIALTFNQRSADRRDEQTVVAALPPAISGPLPRAADPPAVTTRPQPTAVVPHDGRVVPSRTPAVQDRPIQAASIGTIDTVETIGIEPLRPVERLRPIDPIGIPTLDVAPISNISLTPITIEHIEIAPLTPRR